MHWCRLLPIETSLTQFKNAGKIFVWKQNCLLTVLRADKNGFVWSSLKGTSIHVQKLTWSLMQHEVKTLRHTSKHPWRCSEQDYKGGSKRAPAYAGGQFGLFLLNKLRFSVILCLLRLEMKRCQMQEEVQNQDASSPITNPDEYNHIFIRRTVWSNPDLE